MDINLKIGPWTDKKIEKMRPRDNKIIEKWNLKSVEPFLTRSKKSPPPPPRVQC